MSPAVAIEPKMVISSVDEEHHERLWKIKSLPNAVENKYVELADPLEIETSDDSPLYSKWTITIGQGSSPDEMSIVATLNTTFNIGIVGVQSRVIAEFRSGDGKRGIQQASGFLINRKSHIATWTKPAGVNWNWAAFLDSEGEATVYIKLSLFNASTAENMEQKFNRQSVSSARKNLALILGGGQTEFDLKIICSDSKEVKCHKELLKANSPVFKSMLEIFVMESQPGVINVTDIGGAIMEILVQYMYTGQLLATWRDPATTLELTCAAGKYQMTTLLDYLENVFGNILDNCSSSTLMSLKNLAESLSLNKAVAKLTERIINRTLSIKSTDDLASVFENKN